MDLLSIYETLNAFNSMSKIKFTEDIKHYFFI